MGTKSILLAVTDPEALLKISEALGEGWEATPVPGEEEALALLDKRSFDVFLADFNLGESDASELLNQVLEKHPQTPRFLLAYEADLALVAAKVNGPHHILPKPVEPTSLKDRIESGTGPDESSSESAESGSGESVSAVIPPIYAEILKALEAPGVTSRQAAELLARDEALTTQLLTLTHSTWVGLPRSLTEPVEAVEALGLQTVKALVMARRFLAEHDHLKPGYLSFEKMWQHSLTVAQLARGLMLFETGNRALASEALIAGLLHDLGKVVLVANFDDLYARVHSLARKQPVSLWDVEKEMFGANHGQIGP